MFDPVSCFLRMNYPCFLLRSAFSHSLPFSRIRQLPLLSSVLLKRLLSLWSEWLSFYLLGHSFCLLYWFSLTFLTFQQWSPYSSPQSLDFSFTFIMTPLVLSQLKCCLYVENSQLCMFSPYPSRTPDSCINGLTSPVGCFICILNLTFPKLSWSTNS